MTYSNLQSVLDERMLHTELQRQYLIGQRISSALALGTFDLIGVQELLAWRREVWRTAEEIRKRLCED